MIEDLHRSIWFTYRRAIGADASWDATSAFQTALDVYLGRRPDMDPASACSEAARMIMTRPHGIANHGRVVGPPYSHAQLGEAPVLAVARFLPMKAARRR